MQILNAIREHYLMKREADHGSQLFWDRIYSNSAKVADLHNTSTVLMLIAAVLRKSARALLTLLLLIASRRSSHLGATSAGLTC